MNPIMMVEVAETEQNNILYLMKGVACYFIFL